MDACHGTRSVHLGSDLTSITRRRRPTCRTTRNRALVSLPSALSVIALPCAATTTPIQASAASTQSPHQRYTARSVLVEHAGCSGEGSETTSLGVIDTAWAAACAISDTRPTGPRALTGSPRCILQTVLSPRYARRSPMPDPTSTTYEQTIRSLALAPGHCAVRRACLSLELHLSCCR